MQQISEEIKNEMVKYMGLGYYNEIKGEITYTMRGGVLYAKADDGYSTYEMYDTTTGKINVGSIRDMVYGEYLHETGESLLVRKQEYITRIKDLIQEKQHGLTIDNFKIGNKGEKVTEYSYETNNVKVITTIKVEQILKYHKELTYQKGENYIKLVFNGNIQDINATIDMTHTVTYTISNIYDDINNVLQLIDSMYKAVPNYIVGDKFQESIYVGGIRSNLPEKMNFETQGIVVSYPINHVKSNKIREGKQHLPEQVVSIGVTTNSKGDKELTLYSNRLGYSDDSIQLVDDTKTVHKKVDTMLENFEFHYRDIENIVKGLRD